MHSDIVRRQGERSLSEWHSRRLFFLGETSKQARNVHVRWTSCAEDRETERENLREVSGGKVIPNEPLLIGGAYLMFLFFSIHPLWLERIKGAVSWHLSLLLLGANLRHSFSWTSWLEGVRPVDPALPSSPRLSWLQNWYYKMFRLRRDAGFRVLLICTVQSFL